METLKKLIASLKDGSIKEMIAEWKWILGYSRRYKKAIAFYMFLGIFSTVFGLISAVASQKLIDIVTGKQTDRLLVMAVVMVAMALFSLIFNSVISRVSLKISIDIQNDIQADIFDRIVDASWMELMKYHSGDILNRFTNDVNTVATNAITWFPSLVVSIFNFIATFCAQLFREVKEYIRANDVNAYDVADHFHIPLHQVKEWIREGRIEYRENPSAKIEELHCQRCGTPISFGTLCSKCLKHVNSGKGTSVGSGYETDERMHYLDIRKK